MFVLTGGGGGGDGGDGDDQTGEAHRKMGDWVDDDCGNGDQQRDQTTVSRCAGRFRLVTQTS